MSDHDDDRGGVPSGSGMERVAHCPSSFYFESLFKEAETPAANKLRSEGQFLHDVVMEFEPLDKCDDDQISMVKRAWRQRDEVIGASIASRCEDPLREQRIFLNDLDGKVTSVRYDEIWIKDKDTCLLIDYKFGYKDVPDASGNLQLRTQAACVYRNYGYTNIYCAIVSPRCGDPTIVLYDEEQLQIAEKNIIGWCRDASDLGDCKNITQLKAGSWCNYCRARHICPEAWGKGVL